MAAVIFRRRMFRRVAFFLSFLALVTAVGWSRQLPIHIKVLSAATREVRIPVLTPPDCNWKDLSAYCYSSSPQKYIENTMVLQEQNGRALQVQCTTEEQGDKCIILPVNQSFDAWKEKNVLQIRYPDQRGKVRKYVYQIVRER